MQLMTDRSLSTVNRFQTNRTARAAIVTVIMASLVIQAAVARASTDLTVEQIDKLKRGEILVAVNQAEGPARGSVGAAIHINAPVQRIWQVMIDCDEIPTFVPGVLSCEVLDSGENWEIIRHEVKWVWLFPRLSYVFQALYQPHELISFKRISGDLREMRGSWSLYPLGDHRTVVRYQVYLDPGFLIPQWLVRNSLKSDLPEVLKALRSRVLGGQAGQEE